jgi:hypothetical protein
VPIVVPPFVQYQAPLVPLRGLWNRVPPEGDRFINAEIDWQITTTLTNAVQFALAGNSPVAISQIVALSVDNSGCSADVTFLFPDSGFELVVPGYNQGVYPVFTNALMFYAIAIRAGVGDRTIFQVLNSLPPPIATQPSLEQSTTTVNSVLLQNNGATQIVPATVSGTLEVLSLVATIFAAATAESCNLLLRDGNGVVLWQSQIASSINAGGTWPITVSPLKLHFYNGIVAVVSTTTIANGYVNFNLYYGVP